MRRLALAAVVNGLPLEGPRGGMDEELAVGRRWALVAGTDLVDDVCQLRCSFDWRSAPGLNNSLSDPLSEALLSKLPLAEFIGVLPC